MSVIVVRVQPGAAGQRIGPYADGVLNLSVTRKPQGGEATDAARRLLAQAMGVAPSRVRLEAGGRSRLKRFQVFDLGEAEIAARLGRYRSAAD